MKKILLFSLLLFCFGRYAFAQRDKGNWMVGISLLSGNHNKERLKNLETDAPFGDPYKNFDLDLSPRLGRFITNDLVLGLGLRYSYGATKTAPTPTVGESIYHDHNIALEPFARYYFGPVTNKGSFYGELSIDLGTAMSTYTYSSRSNGPTPATQYTVFHDSKTDKKPLVWTARIAAGTTIMLNKNIGIDFSLGVERSGGKGGRSVTNNRKVFDSGTVETSQDFITSKPGSSTVVRLGAGVVVFLSQLKKQNKN